MPRVIQTFFDASSGGDEPHWVKDRRIWILLSMLILTPLGFYRRIGQLKIISYVALCAVANLVSHESDRV